MFDLGDDMILDNFRIPWLIWIQILVMFLLTLSILLCYFGFVALDSSPSSNSPGLKTAPNCYPGTQANANGNHDARREIAMATTNRVRPTENNSDREGSLIKDLTPPPPVAKSLFHPCHYLNFAKQAFLKCLGLGSRSHNARDKEHEHED